MATEFSPSPLVEEARQKLSSYPDEAVLVVERKWKQCGWDMPASRTPYSFEEALYLGESTEPFITEDHFYHLLIYTPRHAVTEDWLRRDEIEVREGSIEGWELRSYNLNKKLGPKPSKREPFGCFPSAEPRDERKEKFALEIIVGDQAVAEWFVDDAQFGMMPDYQKEYLEKYAKQVDPPPATRKFAESIKESSLRLDVLVGYQRMRSALGLAAAVLPVELQDRVNLKVAERKLGIVRSIEELLLKDLTLQRKLVGIRSGKLPRVTVGLEGDLYEKQVRQDEEDLRSIKSYPIREEQQRLQGKLGAAIREAIKWGLHLESWVITREPMPGKKEEIDVPVFIKDLALLMEIPLVTVKR